jgi:hypothetical protein
VDSVLHGDDGSEEDATLFLHLLKNAAAIVSSRVRTPQLALLFFPDEELLPKNEHLTIILSLQKPSQTGRKGTYHIISVFNYTDITSPVPCMQLSCHHNLVTLGMAPLLLGMP